MKYIITLLISTFFSNYCCGQCPTSNITFSTQASIDNFPTDYPGCTTITGNLTVQGNDITNLNGLASLTNITGSLRFSNANVLNDINGLSNLTTIGLDFRVTNCDAITTLHGLNELTSVGGIFIISGNSNLTDINGLPNLETIGGNFEILSNPILSQLSNFANPVCITGNLRINNNDNLINLSGLQTIQSVGANLIISNNASLQNLVGLSGITSIIDIDIFENNNLINFVGLEGFTNIFGNVNVTNCDDLMDFSGLNNLLNIEGNLNVTFNSSLINFAGLSSLNNIGESLIIGSNSSLTSLDGLEGLVSIGFNLQINGNPSLNSIHALSNLLSINGGLIISQNISLPSLSGIDNIDHQSINSVFVTDSPLLSECDVTSICNFIAVITNSPSFSQNALGCNTTLEVNNACLGILPLVWVSLDAVAKDDKISISWQTYYEVNCDFFEVEKSDDGLSFYSIAKVKSHNNASSFNTYDVKDKNANNTSIYYRIKQVDFDGKYSYSKIIAVPMTISKTMIYPNPSVDIIYVRSDKTIDNFVIKDIFGKVQISGTSLGSSIDISSLTNGNYIIEIDTQKLLFTKM